MLRYFASLSTGKTILWCYLIWYCITAFNYFDPTPAIWLNSVGISVVIGFALILSVGGGTLKSADRWQTFRLFLMPFCVSSFSSLIKGQGFMLILPPRPVQQLVSVGACTVFVLFVVALKYLAANMPKPGETGALTP